MGNSRYFASSLLVFTAIVASLLPAYGQDKSSSANVPVTTVVSVLGPKFTARPTLANQDINVSEGKQKREVTDWTPAQGDKAALQLPVVVDDADNQEVASQLNDLRSFINSQPGSTAIGVFYASSGTVQAVSQFSTDHEAVAKSVRIPLGYTGAYSSIYLSVMSLIKGWPVTGGARREVP